jgi:glycosyltransferase involved in cell wall biosynthesis
MNITFILPFADFGGGIRVVAIYADRLRKRGHTVLVVSVPRRPIPFINKIKNLLKRGTWPRRHKPSLSHLDGVEIEHRVLEKCRPVFDDDLPDADVVIATWWETAEWVARLHPSKGKKFYFVQGYDLRPLVPVERVRATYFYPMHKIAVSRWLVDIMETEYGDHNVSYIPNSVDKVLFNAPDRGRQTIPTVGFVYTTENCKGCDIMIRALLKVRESIPELKIVSFGAELPTVDLPLPQETEFYFLPPQEKIPEIYSVCDFWLFGSRSEGFGLPILEAMACHTPVIATRAGAAPELIASGGGILLDNWNVNNMSEKILKAFDLKPEEWKSLSRQARAVASGYSWDDAVLLFEKVLES